MNAPDTAPGTEEIDGEKLLNDTLKIAVALCKDVVGNVSSGNTERGVLYAKEAINLINALQAVFRDSEDEAAVAHLMNTLETAGDKDDWPPFKPSPGAIYVSLSKDELPEGASMEEAIALTEKKAALQMEKLQEEHKSLPNASYVRARKIEENRPPEILRARINDAMSDKPDPHGDFLHIITALWLHEPVDRVTLRAARENLTPMEALVLGSMCLQDEYNSRAWNNFVYNKYGLFTNDEIGQIQELGFKGLMDRGYIKPANKAAQKAIAARDKSIWGFGDVPWVITAAGAKRIAPLVAYLQKKPAKDVRAEVQQASQDAVKEWGNREFFASED